MRLPSQRSYVVYSNSACSGIVNGRLDLAVLGSELGRLVLARDKCGRKSGVFVEIV